MTTLHITLPDDLAQAAADAGLLAPEALETLLREALHRHATGSAAPEQQPWRRHPAELLTPPAQDAQASDALREVVQEELSRRSGTGGTHGPAGG